MSRDPRAPVWARLDCEPPVFFADRPDPEFEGMPILRQRHDGELKHVMSNSFGFGGTNGTLILSKV